MIFRDRAVIRIVWAVLIKTFVDTGPFKGIMEICGELSQIRGMIMYKKAMSAIGVLIVIIMIGLMFANQGDSIPENWPNRDKMEKNLNKKDYVVTISNSIIIDDNTYKGERITASKGNNFIDTFWFDDSAALTDIDQYCYDTYEGGYYYRVGNTLYFGTQKALKDAGVVIKEE
jgi:hypothetical protein